MADSCKRIASFDVDHDYVTPGIYLSRQDGDIDTYDLRTRTPNCGYYMDDITMHSVEHLFATYARNSALGDRVIYFGPMGCQTGFYLLMRDVPKEQVLALVKDVLVKIMHHEGEVFGASRKECGNYLCLSLAAAKIECAAYLDVLESRDWDFTYPTAVEEDYL
jgi:S-ribosylhomocysteine lyase